MRDEDVFICTGVDLSKLLGAGGPDNHNTTLSSPLDLPEIGPGTEAKQEA